MRWPGWLETILAILSVAAEVQHRDVSALAFLLAAVSVESSDQHFRIKRLERASVPALTEEKPTP